MAATTEEVCRAYRNKGRCRYGDECKYTHSEGDAIANPPRGECFNFKQDGECKFGDRCRFKHGEDDPRFDANGDRVRATNDDGTEVKRRRNRRNRPRTDAPREKLDEVCNNFLAGRCRYGENCRRQHPAQ